MDTDIHKNIKEIFKKYMKIEDPYFDIKEYDKYMHHQFEYFNFSIKDNNIYFKYTLIGPFTKSEKAFSCFKQEVELYLHKVRNYIIEEFFNIKEQFDNKRIPIESLSIPTRFKGIIPYILFGYPVYFVNDNSIKVMSLPQFGVFKLKNFTIAVDID